MRINVIYYDVHHMLTLSKTYYNVISVVFDFFRSLFRSLASAQFIVHHQIIRIEFIVRCLSLLSVLSSTLSVCRAVYFTCIRHSFTNHLLAPMNVTKGNQSFGQCTLIQWHLTQGVCVSVFTCFADRFSHPCLMMICKWFSGWHANFVDTQQ